MTAAVVHADGTWNAFDENLERGGGIVASPVEIARVAAIIRDCQRCTDSPTRLCRKHKKILPKKTRCSLASIVGEQFTPGALSPEVARATITRKARQAKRVLQMKRRSGMWGLARAVLGK